MSIATQQEILDALGLSSMSAQAQSAWTYAERAVIEFVGVKYIEQQTGIVEFYPMNEGQAATNDPTYVLDSAASRAVPGFYFSPRIIALRQTPVRSIQEVREDPTGYFGNESGSFGNNTILVMGSDYFLEYEEPGISWSGHLVRRAFWFPMTIGSVKVTYTAGFTAAELAGQYHFFSDAVQIAAQHRYLKNMAVKGGQFANIASEGLGGASTTYRDNEKYGEKLPDDACDLLWDYRNYSNEAL